MISNRPTIFIAWSGPTHDAAQRMVEVLSARGLNIWMSDKIQAGHKYREEIRRNVLNAHAVVAIFPETPSAWQIAESGLAYFDNKLIPVAIDSDQVVEPFSELEVYPVVSSELEAGEGASIDNLTDIISARVGQIDRQSPLDQAIFYLNSLFFIGVPVGGVLFQLYLFTLTMGEEAARGTEFWRSAHTALGAIVYGGAVFIALIFSRAGTSANHSARRLTFVLGKRLFFLWLVLALSQAVVGAVLWHASGRDLGTDWLFFSVIAYLCALFFATLGYVQYSAAYRLEKEQASLVAVRRAVFGGSLFFGAGIVLLTFVIMGMSMKDDWLDFLRHDGAARLHETVTNVIA